MEDQDMGLTEMTPEQRRARRHDEYKRLESILEPSQRERLKTIPARHQYLWLKAVTGNLTNSQAIRAKCQDCSAWEELPMSIRDCTVITCPLHSVRPYREKAK